MLTQPALANSAFAGFSDELIAYFTLFLEPPELLLMSEVNSGAFIVRQTLLGLICVAVFYVFCQEDPVWIAQCLRLHNGNFSYYRSWKLTTFYPRDPRPLEELDKAFCLLRMKTFGSDFLYRRWCRCHMELGNAFMLHDEEQDPTIRRLQKIDVRDLTFQDFYECVADIFVGNAIFKETICDLQRNRQVEGINRGSKNGFWVLSEQPGHGAELSCVSFSQWTVDKLTKRFSSDVKLRITHNLDVCATSPTLKMSFADYFQYAKNQHDETPLYIFDEKFGEKMPSLLEDYRVEDLKVFQEDFLSIFTCKEKYGKETLTKGVKLEAGGKQVRKSKKLASGLIRPDFRWLVIGPQRSGAPWHQDPVSTCAWNSLVKGRKRWAIYPPDSPPPGVIMNRDGKYRNSGLDMSSLMWYLHVYPTLTLDQKPLEIIQEEGETIYVPSGWWHLVLNLELTIAVTQNMVNSHNLLMFGKDMLMDGREKALTIFQHQLRATRPETFDIFRLVQIPRFNGYLSEEMFQQSFHILDYWKPQLKKVLRRHKMVVLPKRTEAAETIVQKVRYPKMKTLTSRVNPTFAVGKRLLVKFFSPYNEKWGEFDFEAYMTPNFDAMDCVMPSHVSKRRKSNVLMSYELKHAMYLRYAMEECFRIERATYQMIERAATSQSSHQLLQRMVPRLFHSGHFLAVDEVDDHEGDGPFWRWPYLIIEYKAHGISLDAITKKGGLTPTSWSQLATWISQDFLSRLHSIPLDHDFRGVYGHSKSEWDWYIHYLLRQRKRAVSCKLSSFGAWKATMYKV
ncbi:hypothetical protein PsorP6_003342 [Peronosclerospora sorghi]|uniref:Uncharacterized protein n=1 Tax=Peronosclerospora sorghi TaxID=230839 RepID=A0ACC0VMD6_9STRA|nr:hypothetical protein PsorP6_003342 [Peronosclerospora sorghi]